VAHGGHFGPWDDRPTWGWQGWGNWKLSSVTRTVSRAVIPHKKTSIQIVDIEAQVSFPCW
jgi:hypothetical protein